MSDPLRYLAPLLVPLTAVLSAVVSEIIVTTIVGQFTYWLMKHETVDLVLALLQFAILFLSSATAVAFVTRLLVRRTRLVRSWPVEHFFHCALLYILVCGAVFEQIGCADNCEGLILGAIKFWFLLAAGGICANLWILRRAAFAKPAI